MLQGAEKIGEAESDESRDPGIVAVIGGEKNGCGQQCRDGEDHLARFQLPDSEEDECGKYEDIHPLTEDEDDVLWETDDPSQEECDTGRQMPDLIVERDERSDVEIRFLG